VGFGVGKGFAFPITAMTRDVGDSGDSRALRGHPSPPMHPTPSHTIPVWRGFEGLHSISSILACISAISL
jgi:hypothetical protein